MSEPAAGPANWVPDPELWRIGRAVGLGAGTSVRFARQVWARWHSGTIGPKAHVCPHCGAATPTEITKMRHARHEAELIQLKEWARAVSEYLDQPHIRAALDAAQTTAERWEFGAEIPAQNGRREVESEAAEHT